MLHNPFTRPSAAASEPAGAPVPPRDEGAGWIAGLAGYRRHAPVPAAIALAAVVSGLLVVGLGDPMVGFIVGSRCADGLDALGCIIMGRLVVVSLAYVAAGLAGAAVLWFLGQRRPVPVGVFAGLTMAAGWMLMRVLSDSTAGAVLIAIAGFGICFAVYQLLFSRVPAPLPLLCLGALGIVVASVFGLPTLGDAVDLERSRDEQERVLAAADFDVYVPRALPDGMQFAGAGLGDGYSASEPSVDVSLRTRDGGSFILTSSRVEASFDPPRDCGGVYPYDPVELHKPCRLVGTTANRIDVYASERNGPDDPVYHARVGRSMVTIKGGSKLEPMPDGVALAIVGSLERTSAHELRLMNGRLDE